MERPIYEKTFDVANPEKSGYVILTYDIMLREDINCTQKVLISLIAALQQNDRFKKCYASNEYFSKKLKVSIPAIKKNMSDLKKKGLIKTHYDRRKHIRFSWVEASIIWYPSKDNLVDLDNKEYNIRTITSRNSSRPFSKIENGPEPIQLKVRRKNPVDKYDLIISHWSDKGEPFARVMKRSSAVKNIKKYTRKKTSPESIMSTIDRAYQYFTDSDFIYLPKNNLGISQFFKPVSKVPATNRNNEKFIELNSSIYDMMKQALPDGKPKSWYNLFYLKNDRALEDILLRIISPESKDIFYDLLLNNVPVGTLSYKKEKMIVKGARLADEFCAVNDYPFPSFKMDFENFMKRKYPERHKFKTYWLASKNFWNSQFGDYILHIKRFYTNELKEI